jgi:glycolate oxidase
MNESSLVTRLREVLRDDQVLTSAEDMTVYAYDGTARLNQPPSCVVLVEDTDQVAQVMSIAQESRTPVVVRGSGTGLAGGSVPVPDSLVLCLVRMNRVLDVDTRNLTLTAEAGAITQAIADRAAEAGLFYPPDPASLTISTIGGNVANNSGGSNGMHISPSSVT